MTEARLTELNDHLSPLQRAARPAEETPPILGRVLRPLLAIPLLAKLIGANVLMAVALAAAVLALRAIDAAGGSTTALLAGALLVTPAVNLGLVWLALRPLGQLEETVERLSQGDLEARAPRSALADRDMARVSQTMNSLLDRLAGDRTRLRRVAAQAIRAGEVERARIADELHESTAQTLAALLLQVSAAARDCRDPELADRLATSRGLAADALEEVRLLAQTVHPRVLEDLGLPAALRHLARLVTERDRSVAIDVDADAALPRLQPPAAAALYRVAEEGVTNALRHARPRVIDLRVSADARVVRLEVADDGCGFDVASADRRPGTGLFALREELALAGGHLEVISRPGEGTRLLADVPLWTAGAA